MRRARTSCWPEEAAGAGRQGSRAHSGMEGVPCCPLTSCLPAVCFPRKSPFPAISGGWFRSWLATSAAGAAAAGATAAAAAACRRSFRVGTSAGSVRSVGWPSATCSLQMLSPLQRAIHRYLSPAQARAAAALPCRCAAGGRLAAAGAVVLSAGRAVGLTCTCPSCHSGVAGRIRAPQRADPMASAQGSSAEGSPCSVTSPCGLADLPRHVLDAIAALLSQRDKVALASCSRELLAASADGWWHTVEAPLGSQAASDSLVLWLRRRRPAAETLHLHLAACDPKTRRAIEVQLPAKPCCEWA